MSSLTRVQGLPPDAPALAKVREWLVTLNGMRAVDNLSDDQARQLSHDLEVGYTAFHAFLKGDR